MTTPRLSTRLFEAGPARLEIDAAEARVVAGPDRGLRLLLGTDSIRIGSAPECELVLHDPTVSARHAEIQIGTRGYVIRDLGSKNGVLLDTVAVERAPLFDGKRIRLGKTTLQVRATGGRHSVPLAGPGTFHGMVAASVKMRAVTANLQRIAATDLTVLLEGETGTGKEVAAQALHRAGARAEGPFVIFDCGAVTPGLVGSELFGHEKGAYSDAHESRPGLFEEADGGTLFLDEIGELPLELQPMLLRALEKKTTRRVGGNVELSHDVRVVAATNRNLAEEVKAKRFREDLFFRLAVTRLRLPPLRERPEDIPVLAQRFAAEAGLPLSPEILAILAAYDWPGNVRELQNVVTRAVFDKSALALGARGGPAGTAIAGRGLLYDGAVLRSLPDARHSAAEQFERLYLEEALAQAGGSISRAAELAGVSRQLLTRLVAKHGLRARDREREGE
jgi:DNA-binding NtrC family response regulator